MTTFILILHVTACVLLAIVILMQAGRGGGLTEQFSSAESVFGAKTSAVMVRITTVLATIFIVTSCTLAVFSARKEQSLMGQKKSAIPHQTITIPISKEAEQAVQDINKNLKDQTKGTPTPDVSQEAPASSSQPTTAPETTTPAAQPQPAK